MISQLFETIGMLCCSVEYSERFKREGRIGSIGRTCIAAFAVRDIVVPVTAEEIVKRMSEEGLNK